MTEICGVQERDLRSITQKVLPPSLSFFSPYALRAYPAAPTRKRGRERERCDPVWETSKGALQIKGTLHLLPNYQP